MVNNLIKAIYLEITFKWDIIDEIQILVLISEGSHTIEQLFLYLTCKLTDLSVYSNFLLYFFIINITYLFKSMKEYSASFL
jgi:hypothetical protein